VNSSYPKHAASQRMASVMHPDSDRYGSLRESGFLNLRIPSLQYAHDIFNWQKFQ
jgi:hypothetical protein